VGARGAAAGGYAVSIGRDCLVGREDLWDSGAAAGGFRSGFRLGSESFPRCGHVREFTYNYVNIHPEHPAPHDLSARLISQAQTSSFNFTNFTNLMTIASVLSKTSPAFGSSSFITNKNGLASQHFQPACRSFGAGRYMPYGEPFVEQKITSTYYTPYKFSGKEKDNETQYSYFGARYYDSDLSVWLSVDPKTHKSANLSPYMYVSGNPMKIVDLFGEENIIVVGYQGPPDKYMTNRYNFYRKAVYYSKQLLAQGESTTVLIYRDDQEEIDGADGFIEEMKKAGVNVQYYSNSQDVIDYINDRSKTDGEGNEYSESITVLVLLSHGTKDAYYFHLKRMIGLAGSGFSLISPFAFSKNAVMLSAACKTGNGIAKDVSKSLMLKVFAPRGTADYSGGKSTGVTLNNEVVYDNGQETTFQSGNSMFSQDDPQIKYYNRPGKQAVPEE